MATTTTRPIVGSSIKVLFVTMAEQIAAILEFMRRDAESREQRQGHEQRRVRKAQLCQATRSCDGSSPSAVREWIQDVEIATKYFSPASCDEDTLFIVSCTLQGGMRRCYERFMAVQPDRTNVTWGAVREHLKRAYLTQDEEEFLKSSLEKLKQSAYESNSTFSRKFEELADQAYPAAQRNAAVENIILGLYMKGLRSTELVRRLVQEGRPTYLNEAIQAVETFSAQEEQFQRICKRAPEVGNVADMEIGAVKLSQDGTMQDVVKRLDVCSRQMEGLQREFTKLKATQIGSTQDTRHAGQRGNAGQRGQMQQDYHQNCRCYQCLELGHIARNCPQNMQQPQHAREMASVEEQKQGN